jgi:hypothetical protein
MPRHPVLNSPNSKGFEQYLYLSFIVIGLKYDDRWEIILI